MICPGCGFTKRWRARRPEDWCADEPGRHTLCRLCQNTQRRVWAGRLEQYFHQVYGAVAA